MLVTLGEVLSNPVITLALNTWDVKKYFKYDFPKNNTVTTDSIYYYETANINFFKVDTTYWVRAYVQIGDQYFYGRSIKFVRQPNITTGDVDWKVGQQQATLYGSVVGFNPDVDLSGENAEGDLVDIDEVANYLCKHAKKEGLPPLHPDEVRFVVEADLDYQENSL
jgi:hypothetical protein